MLLPTIPWWAWIPIVLGAAFAQTIRNAAQRSLTAEAGTLAATLVRFLYGLPFAILWLACAIAMTGSGRTAPTFDAPYFAWIALGAFSQLAATFFLLLAMKERNFIIAVTYSKTEVLQVALFATVFLHEVPTVLAAIAMVLATAGVVILGRPGASGAHGPQRWLDRTAVYGLASGAGFALANVSYRGAALHQGADFSPWLAGAWGVVLAQVLQTLVLGGYLAATQRGALAATRRAWRVSLLAGAMGATASVGWFTAVALRPASDVRTLGMVEVLFSYFISRRIFREKLSGTELAGMLAVALGVVLVCAQL